MSAEGWPCEAYGVLGLQVGARCFIAAQLHTRDCTGPAECAAIMQDARRKLFRRLQELAATGDPVAVALAAEFSDPSQLLGGEA